MDNWQKWLKSKEYKPVNFAPPIKKEYLWWLCVTDSVKIRSSRDERPICPVCKIIMVELMDDPK